MGRPLKGAGYLSFQCNICAQPCAALVDELDREVRSCQNCGSTVRSRSMVHVLSVELFGESLALPDFPVRHDIMGIGMSDWEGYAIPLAGKLTYKNTYYHREPKLDIAASIIDHTLQGTLDFVICSDVFEHVAPPVSTAFENLRKLLKPSGVVIFSVPYGKADKTIEHFPDLYDYEIVDRDGRYILENTTKEGVQQTFERLVFHGGPGATLEMRQFSEASLIENFSKAGLSNIEIYKEPEFKHGIYWRQEWSRPMSVRPS
jgi:SAM-dependent methyltransferase